MWNTIGKIILAAIVGPMVILMFMFNDDSVI